MAIREQPRHADQVYDRVDPAGPAATQESDPQPAQPARGGPARTRSIRVTLVSLLLVPLLALLGLWAFVASVTLGNVVRFQHYNTLTQKTSPSLTPLFSDLAQESALTLIYVGSGHRAERAQLVAVRKSTDAVVAATRTAMASTRSLYDPVAISGLDTFLADLAALPQIRAAVDSGADDTASAYRAYAAISTALWEFLHISAPPADPTLSVMNQSVIAAIGAEDASGGAMSLISASLAGGGQMSQSTRTLFAEVVGQQNIELSSTFTLASPGDKVIYAHAFNSKPYRQLLAVETQVENSPANKPIPVNPQTFQALATQLQTTMRAPLGQMGGVLSAQSAHLEDGLVTQLALAGGLGLVAVLVSAFVAVRFGRRLRDELTGLFNSARQMAHERLPHLVERLRRGEDVDVVAESPPLPGGRITEITRVADAFSTVQRTAVDAAVGQANLRKGVNQVFLNLSLRNQSLLHRQLGVLDAMERATHDPAALGDLFRLDHLTTRMRRHAEGLIILSGATPGRGWRDPVPIQDVLRAAIAEVEDYIRVDVASESRDAVAGTAVNDVIHLVAELVENATTFSPPNTQVEIRAGAVGIGFAVEVEDRGLGLTRQELAAINAQLASPPEFDLAHSEQLGLFVVGQLAARHGIRVSLRESPYGGTTAIVLLPHSIIVRDGEAGLSTPDSASERPPARVNGSSYPAGGTDPVGSRARASAFGLTGRHRSEAAAADASQVPARDIWQPATRQEPSPERFPWDTPSPEVTPEPAAVPRPSPDQLRPSVPSGTYRGLPRRVRQANLAPQLRGQNPAAQPPGEPSGRSPEDTRSMMSSLQDGWLRGRVDDLDYPDDAPDAPDGNDGEAR
jgi:signal transduction histidine kinase